MKLSVLILSLILVLYPGAIFAVSDKVEETVATESSDKPLGAVMPYVHKYLTSAKKFLGTETRSLKKWLNKTLIDTSRGTIPKVKIDLPPPLTIAQPTITPIPAQPKGKPESYQKSESSEPEPEPEPEPKAEAAPTTQTVAIKKMGAIFTEGTNPQETVRNVNQILPGTPKPSRSVEMAIAQKPKKDIPALRQVPEAGVPILKSKPAPTLITLSTTTLSLGQFMTLGSAYDGNEKKCISKQNGHVFFCIRDITWPEHIRSLFDNAMTMYQGSQAVVRYDGKKLTHAHIQFFTTDLQKVVSFMEKRFGPPLEILQRIVTPFEGRPKKNPTLIWSKNHTVDGTMKTTTLEVRAFDDSRGGFPDMKHGLVRLYDNESLPIFPRVSATEMMLVKHSLN